MTHIFKPGDRAYWMVGNQWVELVEASDYKQKEFTIQTKERGISFTAEGKNFLGDNTVSLLPLNPYDPCDPNNPPEFRYPFMLNGRPVREGDRLKFKVTEDIFVVSLSIEEGKPFVYRKGTRVPLNSAYLCWPDELPVKKKVAKWVYLIIGIPGVNTVGFTEEMTEEEARKGYGTSVQMIPGTEREVEL